MANVISKVTLENGDYDIKTLSIPFGKVDSTSTKTAFTATIPGITSLYDGVCMYLRNDKVDSTSGFTININNLGAKPVYSTMADNGRATDEFMQGFTMLFIYNSSRITGGCWDMYIGLNTESSSTVEIGYNNQNALPGLHSNTERGFYRSIGYITKDSSSVSDEVVIPSPEPFIQYDENSDSFIYINDHDYENLLASLFNDYAKEPYNTSLDSIHATGCPIVAFFPVDGRYELISDINVVGIGPGWIADYDSYIVANYYDDQKLYTLIFTPDNLIKYQTIEISGGSGGEDQDTITTWWGTITYNSTATNYQNLTGTCTDFTLHKGAIFIARATNGHTHAGAMKLSVNGTGYKDVRYKNAAISSSNKIPWSVNEDVIFVYDGTYWRYITPVAATTSKAGIVQLSDSTSTSSSTVAATSTAVKAAYDRADAAYNLADGKQDALTPGDNIQITNNVISATDTTYTAGDGINIDSNNVISTDSPQWYAICETATATTAKIVTTLHNTITPFSLTAGNMVVVKFTNEDQANQATTLNVDGTGAIELARGNITNAIWGNGGTQTFIYDGNKFYLVDTHQATNGRMGQVQLTNSYKDTSSGISSAIVPTAKALADGLATKQDTIVVDYLNTTSKNTTAWTTTIGSKGTISLKAGYYYSITATAYITPASGSTAALLGFGSSATATRTGESVRIPFASTTATNAIRIQCHIETYASSATTLYILGQMIGAAASNTTTYVSYIGYKI